jgi:nucleoside-diphosphate-sugar epimerase
MAAMKFGASGNPALSWAMNVHAPAIVAETFAASRIVAFSTGCVYPFVPVAGGGATEETPATPPPGDYAASCVGRERMFEHFSQVLGTPGRIVRLNYAIDMRYGVLHDVGAKVRDGASIDLAMGHVNVIWQGDANAVALRCLAHATKPTTPINVTGPEIIGVRELAEAFGRRLGRAPKLTGTEAAAGWLSNASRMVAEFGSPRVPLERMIDWTADWLMRGGASLGKPTRYEVRDGRF